MGMLINKKVTQEGHVDKRETPIESVIREVKEETGLSIRNPVFFGIKHWYHIEIFSNFKSIKVVPTLNFW